MRPGAATNARRTRAISGVRPGTRPRSGFEFTICPENERAGLKREWTRPSASIARRSESTQLSRRRRSARHRKTSETIGCAFSIRSSASIEVLQPVFVWLTIGSFSSSKRTAPSCFDELTLKG